MSAQSRTILDTQADCCRTNSSRLICLVAILFSDNSHRAVVTGSATASGIASMSVNAADAARSARRPCFADIRE